jgi:hypothetical protein
MQDAFSTVHTDCVRVILKSHDRRNQRYAIGRVTEIICNSFRVN